jgi:DNA-binding LytR/AlgR family response regulator
MIKTIIDNYMMNNDIEYKYLFINNNEEIPITKDFKVFILDKISIAEYLRNKLDDWNSLIIITTNHNEMKNEVIGKGLFLFDFLSKKDFFKKKLIEDLKHIIKHYNDRDNCLIFKSQRIIRKIDLKSINIIKKEKASKRCLLKSTYGDYYIPETLNKIEERLDNRFIKINRSCIINIDDLIEYDLDENKITMKNEYESLEVSRNHKKEIEDYFNNYK